MAKLEKSLALMEASFDDASLDKIKNEIQSRLQPMTLVAIVEQGPTKHTACVKLSDGLNNVEGQTSLWQVIDESDAANFYDNFTHRLVMAYAKQVFLVKR